MSRRRCSPKGEWLWPGLDLRHNLPVMAEIAWRLRHHRVSVVDDQAGKYGPSRPLGLCSALNYGREQQVIVIYGSDAGASHPLTRL